MEKCEEDKLHNTGIKIIYRFYNEPSMVVLMWTIADQIRLTLNLPNASLWFASKTLKLYARDDCQIGPNDWTFDFYDRFKSVTQTEQEYVDNF